MNHFASKSYTVKCARFTFLLLFFLIYLLLVKSPVKNAAFQLWLRCLLLHIFFCHVILGFLKSFIQVPELGKSFWREGEVILICQFIFFFLKVDKISATTLLMSCFDELPRAFLNTLTELLNLYWSVIDPSEIWWTFSLKIHTKKMFKSNRRNTLCLFYGV